MSVPALRFPEFAGDWEEAKAGDAFANSRAKGEAGLPLYSVTMDRGLVRRDSLDRHMHGDAADETNLRAKPDDIVYNMMRMWQGAAGIAEEECMVSPAYVVLSPKEQTSSAFFNYRIENARMLYLLWAYSHGLTSDRLRLYFSDFARIPMRQPSLPEQKKIASFLGVVDAKIAALRARRAGLERYKRGLMQALFSQSLRFAKEDGTAFPDWEEKRLGEVLHEHKAKSTGKEQVFSVSVHKGLVNQIEHLGRSFSAANTDHYNRVKQHDIVYTKSPTGDFPLGIIKQSYIEEDVIVSPLYGVFTPETPALGRILHVHFESHVNVSNYLSPIVQKGAKNTINVTNAGFLSNKLKLPVSHEEQQKIADALSAMDAKIAAVAGQVTQLEAFKKGLLQQMFV
ncbi:restriction endonuclease subunit S [Pseudogemmobacter sp. W21_MBD1_M6]|uniref:restriction endonuclease subunit S n=1 Tax=Pseudogemmobacter sp. W21_MBD1_M6 TaxID=3240271 RepID=UPI003F95DE07